MKNVHTAKYKKNRSIFELIVRMRSMIVIAIQDRIVDELYLFLLIVVAVLGQLLLCDLLLNKRRRVRPPNFLHKVSHQFLTKTIQRTSGKLIAFFIEHLGLYFIHSTNRFVNLLCFVIVGLSLVYR